MKLEPIAKPIRIRIKLGDCEYSDFKEVKEHLSGNFQDLLPLFTDDRLERWLRQIGESSLADKASKLRGNRNYANNGTLQLLRLFIAGTDNKDISAIFISDRETRIIDDQTWGELLADSINNEKDYRNVFTTIVKHTKDSTTFGSFYKKAKEKKYELESVIDNSTSIKDAKSYYERFGHQEFGINWPQFFYFLLTHKEKDKQKAWKLTDIREILRDDQDRLNEFYKLCADNGIKEAEEFLDPWIVLLKNEEDKKKVIAAIDDWYYWNNIPASTNYESDFGFKEKYSYDRLSQLGQQIIDFIIFLKHLCNDKDKRRFDELEKSKDVENYLLKEEASAIYSVYQLSSSGNIEKKKKDCHTFSEIKDLKSYIQNSNHDFEGDFLYIVYVHLREKILRGGIADCAFTIKGIQFGWKDSNKEVIADFGEKAKGSKWYLRIKIDISIKMSINARLGIKIIRRENYGSTHPVTTDDSLNRKLGYCLFTKETTISENHIVADNIPYKKQSRWEPGEYKVEIWYNSRKLDESSFLIY